MGESNKVQLLKGNPSVVKLQLNKDNVKSFSKEGNDLKVILNNGEVITIVGFFTSDNSLVLEGSNALVWVDFVANGDAINATYSTLSDIEPLLYDDNGMSALAWIAIPLAAGGMIAWAANDSDDDSGSGSKGATGETGTTGENGATGSTGATGATGENGATGGTGATGADGKSLLELLIDEGKLPPGSDINDLIDYLKGADGATGATGAAGADGKSALELLIEAGELPSGSDINDLIDYLKGADGATGATGAAGADGKSALELL
ncbi:BapA/Bap/LapF family prefix-like domain-containing protein, partial [Acinetobacter sp. SWAC57]|uniref:BapA/Bap/LapF family prefix-like domain-containing protein n=1 Tax=Acinetobacter sp. SWAC57 TaxID=2293834 RepID=UPI002249A025